MTCGGRSWAGPERGSEILCVLTHGMGSTPPHHHHSIIIILLILLLFHVITPIGLQLYLRDMPPCGSISQYKKDRSSYESSPDATNFHIAGSCLNIQKFSPTWAELTFSCNTTIEILRRINLASSAFGSLREREFSNRSFMIHKKIAVYNTVVIFTTLFVYES